MTTTTRTRRHRRPEAVPKPIEVEPTQAEIDVDREYAWMPPEWLSPLLRQLLVADRQARIDRQPIESDLAKAEADLAAARTAHDADGIGRARTMIDAIEIVIADLPELPPIDASAWAQPVSTARSVLSQRFSRGEYQFAALARTSDISSLKELCLPEELVAQKTRPDVVTFGERARPMLEAMEQFLQAVQRHRPIPVNAQPLVLLRAAASMLRQADDFAVRVYLWNELVAKANELRAEAKARATKLGYVEPVAAPRGDQFGPYNNHGRLGTDMRDTITRSEPKVDNRTRIYTPTMVGPVRFVENDDVGQNAAGGKS